MLQWIKRKVADKVRKLVGQELSSYTIRMTPEWEKLAQDAAPKVNTADITEAVLKSVTDNVVVDLTTRAGFISKVANEIDVDLDTVSRNVADCIDVADIARELDISEVAREIEVDTGDVADRVAENIEPSDIANEIDLSDLAGYLDVGDLADKLLPKLSGELYTELVARLNFDALDYRKLAAAMLQELLPKEVGANNV